MWGEQKGPSIPPTAGLPSSLPAFWWGKLIATYFYVRLIPPDRPEARQNLFEQPVKMSFSAFY